MTTQTPPCIRCGTTQGLAWRGRRGGPDARRADGTRYGVPGLLCYACYQWASRQPTATPCADCQTTGGAIPAGHHRPSRTDGDRYGFDGVLCWECAQRARWRKQKRERVARPRPMRPRVMHPASIPTDAERDEIRDRLARVRAAKQQQLAAGGMDRLEPAELERVLPAEGRTTR